MHEFGRPCLEPFVVQRERTEEVHVIRSIKLHTPNDEIIYSLRHSSIEMVCEENTEIDCTYAALS